MTLEERQKEFSELIKKALAHPGFDAFANRLDIPKGIFQLWANGTDLPHPATMNVIGILITGVLFKE